MKTNQNPKAINLIILIGIVGILPVIFYIYIIFGVQNIEPEKAIILLQKSPENNILVDIRSRQDYEKEHITASVNLPYDDISEIESYTDFPENLKNKKLFLICDGGILSSYTVLKLQDFAEENLFNISGGMQKWKLQDKSKSGVKYLSLKSGDNSEKFEFKESSFFEQSAIIISAFVVKPLYMILSLLLVFMLIGNKNSDMTALRNAFLFFFIGESFCAVNFLFFNEKSHFIEYLHNFGMVMAFGFTSYAIFEMLDIRILKFTNKKEKCSIIKTCVSCWKNSYVKCKMKNIFLLMIPMFIILSLIPLLSNINHISYNSAIFDTNYDYIHAAIYQIFETKYLPVIAIIFFFAGFVILLIDKHNAMNYTKIAVSIAWGMLGFSFFRLIFLNIYSSNPAWFIVWEEITELLFVLTGLFTILIFRQGIFAGSNNKTIKYLSKFLDF